MKRQNRIVIFVGALLLLSPIMAFTAYLIGIGILMVFTLGTCSFDKFDERAKAVTGFSTAAGIAAALAIAYLAVKMTGSE